MYDCRIVLVRSYLTAVRMLILHRKLIKAPRQAVHHIADSSEPPNPTGPTLDMLTQPTERDKLKTAIRIWALVDPLLVARALQVLVEPCERFERGIAQETLVLPPIPRELRRPHPRRGWRLVMTLRPSDQPRGVRNVVFLVGTDNQTIELLACHVRRAGARLEVEHERRGRNEGPLAAAAGTPHVGRLMYFGIQVMPKVTFVLETPFAIGAVGMLVAIVTLELRVTTEYLMALLAGVMVLVCALP